MAIKFTAEYNGSFLGKKKVVSFDTTFKNNPMNISKNEIFFRILRWYCAL